jgi:hypothetical protein
MQVSPSKSRSAVDESQRVAMPQSQEFLKAPTTWDADLSKFSGRGKRARRLSISNPAVFCGGEQR